MQGRKRQPGYFRQLLKYYYLKLVRNEGTPEYIARGVALGLAVGFIVPMFFQVLAVIPLAFLFRAAKVPAVAFTFVTNHFTVFIIYPVQCWIGSYLLMNPLTYGELKVLLRGVVTDPSWQTFKALGIDVGLAFLAGGIFFTLLTAPLSYLLTVKLVCKYREKREKRRLKKERARAKRFAKKL